MTRRKSPDTPGQRPICPVMTSWIFVMVETARDIRSVGVRPLTHPVFSAVLSVRGWCTDGWRLDGCLGLRRPRLRPLR